MYTKMYIKIGTGKFHSFPLIFICSQCYSIYLCSVDSIGRANGPFFYSIRNESIGSI